MRIRAWVVMLLLLPFSSGMAMAVGNADHAEASMHVSGTLDIDASGAVTAYAIDHRRAVDPAVMHLIDRAVPKWRFEPLPSGAAAPATPVELLIVARQVVGSQYAMRIQSANIGHIVTDKNAELAAVSLRPPVYPARAYHDGIEGTVYLVLRIDRTGHVSDAMVEQADVSRMPSESESARARKLLGDATVLAAKAWTFRPPTTGPSASDAYWLCAVPVSYEQSAAGREYAQWHDYIPGPKQPIPWPSLRGKDDATGAEALASGAVSMIGSGRHLMTSLGAD